MGMAGLALDYSQQSSVQGPEMTSQVKALVAKPEGLFGSWNPQSRRKGTDSCKLQSDLTYNGVCFSPHRQTDVKQTKNPKQNCVQLLWSSCMVSWKTHWLSLKMAQGPQCVNLGSTSSCWDSHAGVPTSRCPHQQDGYSSLPPPAPPQPLLFAQFPFLC